MCFSIHSDTQQRLQDYLESLSTFLTDKRQATSFATYMMGLLSPLERKSLEPIASLACPCPHHGSAAHQRLQHFGTDSNWPDEPTRNTAVQYALEQMLRHGPILVSILDDTAILKKGKHSVGVQHQYAGCVGKVANCQVAPTLVVANAFAHLPVNIELYLPRLWTDSNKLREEARIPDDVQFLTKPELGLQMIDAAQEQGIPLGVLAADSGFGNSQPFRNGVRLHGLHYLVGVQGSTRVKLWDRTQGYLPSQHASEIGQALTPRDFAIYTIPGSPKPRHVRLCFRQVLVPGDIEKARQWLLVEWRPEEKDPLRYYLCSLPKSTRRRRLIQILKARWRVEMRHP